MTNRKNYFGRPRSFDDYIYGEPYGGARMGPVDLEGRPVQRTKRSHPYSYDGHVVTRARRNAERMECAYTDRMWSWDSEKMKLLTDRHMAGYRWDNCPADLVEAFLRDWADDPGLQLIAVMEWCNWASGYPLWSLHWVYSPEKQEEFDEESRKRAYTRGCASLRCEKKFTNDDDVVLVYDNIFPYYYCKGCAPEALHEEEGSANDELEP